MSQAGSRVGVVRVRCRALHQTEARREKPGDSGREDEAESGHEDDCSEDEEAGSDFGKTDAESEDSNAKKREDKAGLQRNENP